MGMTLAAGNSYTVRLGQNLGRSSGCPDCRGQVVVIYRQPQAPVVCRRCEAEITLLDLRCLAGRGEGAKALVSPFVMRLTQMREGAGR